MGAAPSQKQEAPPPWLGPYLARGDGVGTGLTVIEVPRIPTPAEAPPEAVRAQARELAERAGALLSAERARYAAPPAPLIPLRNGTRMPAVGLGTWKAERGEVRAAVAAALQAGYRHIDCAAVYGNEGEVGEALGRALSRGHVAREDLYICSKLWNSDHSRVRAACLKSLAALQLDYLDLYLIHWPVTGSVGELRPPIRETWAAMEALVREGLVRSIGVSNFSVAKLEELLSYATVPPAVCQVEVHPYHRNDALLAWCGAHGVHVTAYSPLGSPDSESLFPRKKPLVLMQDAAVRAVAACTGKNVGQVLIRWGLQHGTSVIPKSTSAERIRGNLQVFDWELSSKDYAALSTLRFQQRMVNGAPWLHPRGPYRTMQDLWDEPEPEDGDSDGDKGPPPDARRERGSAGGQPSRAPAPGAGGATAAAAEPRAAAAARQRAALGDGRSMPLLGFGTWKSKPGETRAAVLAALRAGYRHIDCAEIYGNEGEVGEALAQAFQQGLCRREDVWVTSKLWNAYHAAKDVRPAVQRSLKALRLDYLDLYLIHWPVTGNAGASVQPPIRETWTAMEALVREGLVRSIGVSNFSSAKLQNILGYATIPPAVCQVEAHPYFRNDALLAWCKAHGVHVTAYSPLGSPDSASVLHRKAGPSPMKDPVVIAVAARLGRSPAQVLVRWALQRGTSVLPKSVHPDRIQANADVWDWELGPEDMQALGGLPTQQRMVDGSFWLKSEGPYRTLQHLWDE